MGTALDEVPVQIPKRHLEGGLFLAFIALIPVMLLQLFIRLEILSWAVTIAWLFVFVYIMRKIYDTQVKAGPARGWFRRGMLNAWVSLDGEELVVRTVWKGQEAYRPSRIEWTMPQAFTVKEGDTCFDLVFQSPDDATRFAARLKANIPKITESTIP